MNPIEFPILFRFGRSVIPFGADGMRHWAFRHISGDRFAMREGRTENDRLFWIVDGNGCFRSAKAVSFENAWLRPIKMIWNFSRVVYEIQPPRAVTIGELKKEILGGSRDPEKSSARSFLRFLSTKADSEPFTREMFLSYMREPIGQKLPL